MDSSNMGSTDGFPRVIADRYEVVRVLGEGSSAGTLLCSDRLDPRHVALKELRFSQLEDWKQLEFFEREAKVLAMLDHPAIPKVFDFFRSQRASTSLYIVQELIEGKSLQERMDSGPMPRAKRLSGRIDSALLRFQR